MSDFTVIIVCRCLYTKLYDKICTYPLEVKLLTAVLKMLSNKTLNYYSTVVLVHLKMLWLLHVLYRFKKNGYYK
jgi:hypothetical protein